MENVMVMASFKLNNENLLDDWKKLSAGISENLKNEDGFISRDSVISEDGTVFCLVKWENQEKRDAFSKKMEEDSFKEKMAGFAKIVDLKTMKSEIYKVI